MKIIFFSILYSVSLLSLAQTCSICAQPITKADMAICGLCAQNFHSQCLQTEDNKKKCCPLCGEILACVLASEPADKIVTDNTSRSGYCANALNWVIKQAKNMAKGIATTTVLVGAPLGVYTTQTITSPYSPEWSYIAVDTLSIYALAAASGAPIIQLIKYWQEYLRTGAVRTHNSTWLALDFCGRFSLITMLLIQKLVQNVDLSVFNFLTPGAALAVEIVLIGSVMYFRCRQNKDFFPLDDQAV